MKKIIAGLCTLAMVAGVMLIPIVRADDTTVVVSPANMQGWTFFSENTAGGSGSLVNGPATPPAGSGSVQLEVPLSTNGYALGILSNAGLDLNDITKLEYYTYRQSGDPATAIALQFNIDPDSTDANTGWQGRLVYEPYHTQTVTDDTWQKWDTMADAAGTGTGNWWFSNGTVATAIGCTQANPCTWSELKTKAPNAEVHSTPTLGGIVFKAGSGWTGFVGNVDSFTLGISGNNTTYDFELENPDTTNPTNISIIDPVCGSTVTQQELDKIDWTDSTDESTPITYVYQAAYSNETNDDGSFTTPIYTSSPLTDSEIATPNTPEGTYYVQVQATDNSGNTSAWSPECMIIVNNTPAPTPSPVTVTIVKYINGEPATAENANNTSFPMHAVFPGGEGDYTLSPTGYNNPSPYQATTSDMPTGSDYSTYENIPTECTDNNDYALSGYSTGNSLLAAEQNGNEGTTLEDEANFTNLESDKFVIVWNRTCDDSTPPPADACSYDTAPAGYTLYQGSSGNDRVTLAPNTMFIGNGGNDRVDGGDGNYIVCTGNGNDRITLGNGHHVIDSDGGNDRIEVGDGTSHIDAGNGNNHVETGDGDKHVTAGNGNDRIDTGAGNDTVNAGNGNNHINTFGGTDTITAGNGNDRIDAGAGNDSCSSDGGKNRVTNCAP